MVEIIAEAGLNHKGNLDLALDMVEAAAAADADVIKFQTFDPSQMYPDTHPSFKILTELRLSQADFISIAKNCEKLEIEFMSTPGDVDSLKFLVWECGVKRIKIGSDDLTNEPLLSAAEDSGLPIILSTGMATMDEVCDAMDKLRPSTRSLTTILHCVSSYPCAVDDVNLNAMDTLGRYFGKVGYSDHTKEGLACIVAASKGAIIIEKHFMLRDDPGCIDYLVSIDQWKLQELISKIRQVEFMLGTGSKVPCEAEKKNIPLFRKGKNGRRCA
jgi:sialic acid synthase SpsE